ncbi:hypothetical protein V2G26_019044 [Clonostachys chloroleuca]
MAGSEEKVKLSLGKRLWLMLAPDADKDEDGRDNFKSRSQFVLCAMGGAVGLGNLLRFPSVVFNNYGLQFFIPYVFALFLIGIPILILEIVLGQAFRAGCVTAFNNVNHRAKGVGLAVVFNGFTVVGYYVPILAWAMVYFRQSFQSPLPWAGKDTTEYFLYSVVRNPDPVGGEDGGYKSYPGRGIVGETAGWCFFTWLLVLMCTFKGVGLQGRVIYITMALPLVMIAILAIRSLSLPNASDGFRLYVGVWRSESLQGPTVWQDAFGQMFFSIGVGFGYFTSYASYNNKFANAVQDAFIIALSNSSIEIISALAVMGIVGYLGMTPGETRLSTFSSGFFTYPEALAQMPGSNFFSALFFLTLFLLGVTCVFALSEVLVTLICDTDWGKRVPHWVVSLSVLGGGSLISLIYCSEFGFNTLDAIDMFVNDLALFFTVWCEIFFATSLYRWRDPVDQIGWIGFGLYNVGYVFAHIIGCLLGHVVDPRVGAGVGFGVFILSTVGSVVLSKTPTVTAPGFWGNNVFLGRLWYAAFYCGNQLKSDINAAIVTGKNWRLHWVWPVLLKYITAPAIGIVFSFAYPKFINNHANDPPFIYSFALMHIVMVFVVGLAIFPRFANTLIPAHRIQRGDGKYAVQPRVIIGEPVILSDGGLEGGRAESEDGVSKGVQERRTSSDIAGEPSVVNEKP